MIPKRGQVTVFIIVGIMVLLIVALGFYFTTKSITPQTSVEDISAQKVVVRNYVETCLQISTKEALTFVGKQGGYYLPPVNSEPLVNSYIPYYIVGGEIKMPSPDLLEEELNRALKDILPACLNDLVKIYNARGVDIDYTIKKIETNIGESSIDLHAHIPFKIYVGTQEIYDATYLQSLSNHATVSELDTFQTSLNIPYGRLFETSQKMVLLQAQNPEFFPLGEISNLAFEEDFQFEILSVDTPISESEDNEVITEPWQPDDHNKIIISIRDADFFNEPYYFSFAFSYDVNYNERFAADLALAEEDLGLDEEPVIEEVEELVSFQELEEIDYIEFDDEIMLSADELDEEESLELVE